MRLLLGFLLFIISSLTHAEVGTVTKILNGNTAYLLRDNHKISLSEEVDLELNDEIHSQESYVVLLLNPATQISLARDSVFKITQHELSGNQNLEKTSSVIEFIKGIIRLKVTKVGNEEIEQKVKLNDVAFGVRGTEFEVSRNDGESVDLDVLEGEVEVTSPLVHTFVPEIVKANEGFRFDRRKQKFERRKFSPKFKNHPGFKDRAELKARWEKIKSRKIKNKTARKLKRNKIRRNK